MFQRLVTKYWRLLNPDHRYVSITLSPRFNTQNNPIFSEDAHYDNGDIAAGRLLQRSYGLSCQPEPPRLDGCIAGSDLAGMLDRMLSRPAYVAHPVHDMGLYVIQRWHLHGDNRHHSLPNPMHAVAAAVIGM